MIKVFENFELAIVGQYQSFLEGEGIKTHLKNQFVSGGLGDIPFVAAVPELWVLYEEDVIRAKALIAELQEQDSTPGPEWTCSECGTIVGGEFGQCWKCGTPAEQGEEGDTSPN